MLSALEWKKMILDAWRTNNNVIVARLSYSLRHLVVDEAFGRVAHLAPRCEATAALGAVPSRDPRDSVTVVWLVEFSRRVRSIIITVRLRMDTCRELARD